MNVGFFPESTLYSWHCDKLLHSYSLRTSSLISSFIWEDMNGIMLVQVPLKRGLRFWFLIKGIYSRVMFTCHSHPSAKACRAHYLLKQERHKSAKMANRFKDAAAKSTEKHAFSIHMWKDLRINILQGQG